MAESKTLSGVNWLDAAQYLRLIEPDADDISLLCTLLDVARAYIAQYTGQTAETLDTFPDMVIVALVLVQDMWDNRTLYVDNTNLNHVVTTILDSHRVNFL